jgi:CelD/BcsL family acetyltransferase involved in cellulose biosynthesis
MVAVDTVQEVASEWDALADRSDSGPFVRPGWFEAWARAFSSQKPFVVTVRRHGRLAGALPVLPTRMGTTRSPTNWHTPLYGPVYEDVDAARELADRIVAAGGASVDLKYLASDDPFAGAYAEAARARGYKVISRSALRSPYIDLVGDMESFEASLPKKFRKELDRRKRRLTEQGEVSIAFGGAGGSLDELLDEGFAIEGSGWKKGTALAEDAAAASFYREVAHWAAGRGWLHLGMLRLDGRPIAFSFCLAANGSMNVVKVGFDPAFRRYAPGSILTEATIASAFEAGLARYDFLGAEDAYKLDWTTQVASRLRIQVFSPSAAGRAAHAVWAYGRPVLRGARDGARTLAKLVRGGNG